MLLILQKFLLIFFYVFLLSALFSSTVGLPGNWILVGAAFVTALVTHFTKITWGYFLLCLGLALLGEGIETLLGSVVVAKKGASRWGIVGSFAGGFSGVILGAPVVPPFGSVLFGFAGAFLGAVLGEYANYRNVDAAVRIGFWAFWGRAAALAGKIIVGCVIFWIIVLRTW